MANKRIELISCTGTQFKGLKPFSIAPVPKTAHPCRYFAQGLPMEIKNFKECPEDLPTIATWIIEEFFADKPQHTVENMVSRMKGSLRNAVPLGLASFEGCEPTGTVSLLEQDLGRSSELSPWVAGLYVRPEYRKKGIGTSLVNAVVVEAHGMGYGAVYLYTEIPQFYEKLKWQIHSGVQGDEGVFIMSRLLAN